ncbi:eukaryotic translation initiation factor 5B-like [Bidens hawaiensis]|uniref:eukaryotic translation initiation factor 5B-like n=1 Tax=Bidens hawaiensis TaxID=980011 RepID=UPI004049C103
MDNEKSLRLNDGAENADNKLEIQFTGKKKLKSKMKKIENSFGALAFALLGAKQQFEDEDDEPVISFTGKKKKKKSKSNKKESEDDNPAIDVVVDEPEKSSISIISKEADVLNTSKNKKKKNKDGRIVQEEDDIDKILAELGAAIEPTQAETVQVIEPAAAVAVEGCVNEEAAESASAKKKKKKVAKAVESKAEKKVPKHVRAMQETLARHKEAEEIKKREEEEKLKKELEARMEQEECERIEEESKRLKKEREREKKLKKKQEGKPVTAKEKKKAQRLELTRKQILENSTTTRPVSANNLTPHQQAVDSETEDTKEESKTTLRSPICCIMGHVDTGKTKLPDCIRQTNVQEGEAGGITQQIGFTYIPVTNIRERTKELKSDAKIDVPGLLVIDTPGHESFKNLRSRGSGLCDIAILVVDIMHGLEQQTIESLKLLRMRNTHFIVALNKVDRLYGWKTCRNAPIGKALKLQSKDVRCEFDQRVTQVITQFKEQGLNTELYNKNKYMGETYSIVPTSAISDEGIPELLLLSIQWAQKAMVERLTYSSEFKCVVLEVKVLEGCGTTIDVILVNGVLHVGDEIVVCGFQGPIHTTIRSLLTPKPMKELRVKGDYIHHKEIKAAQGIKITAHNLNHVVAGTALYVVGPDDNVEELKVSVMEDMSNVMSTTDKSGEGVYVQASTLGSLEALLDFQKSPDVSIPVSGIGVGPVHKKDVMKASVMLEKKKEFATILAFDVKVTPEAQKLADDSGVKIFTADIIYHLFDKFKVYMDNIKEEKRNEAAEDVVFPCKLEIMPNCVYRKKDLIILGVVVKDGILKIGTPICIPKREFIDIGRVSSIKNNNRPVDRANKGQQVSIEIRGGNAEEQQKMFGRHFEMNDELVSRISRKSIDTLKAYYRVT